MQTAKTATLGEDMRLNVLFILIISLFSFCIVRYVKAFCQGKAQFNRLKQATKNALRATFGWALVLGSVFLFLWKFDSFSKFGYRLLSEQTIEDIRRLLHSVFNTTSVYNASTIVASLILLVFEIALVFACVGLCALKTLFVLKRVEWTRLGKSAEREYVRKVDAPCVQYRLFLGFSNLRI